MKLGLLLALTGAALVLNLSEGRIVSKCELRQKLQQVLPLPRKYGRYKDQILALVTCELERRSQLDSNLVTGNAVLPTAAARQTTQASEGNQTATDQDIDSTISSAPMINSTLPILRRKRWASMKDFRERSDKRRGEKGQSSDESGDSDNSSGESHERKNSKEGHGSSETESHKMENHGVNKPTASSRTTEMSNGVSGNPRQKRDASSEEKGHQQRGNKKQGQKKRGKKGRDSDESDNSSEDSHEMGNHGVNKPTASTRTTEMSNGVSDNPRQKRDASSEEKGHKQRGNKKQGDKKWGKKGRGSDESEESEESDNSSEESHDMENHGANKPTASSRTTEMSNGVSGNPRQKRDASYEERGNKRRGKKGRDNKKRGDKRRGNKGRDSDESNESGESKQKNKKEKKPSKHSHESSSQEEYNMEQNQGPSNYFGLFQLSDSFFCDSGNGLSKNLCDTNCSAFIDDDITDDLECFAYKGYWRSILDEVSSSCSDQQDTYFDECE